MKITHIQIVRDDNFTPYNHSKNRSAMSNAIKDLNMSFSLSISFEVEWHNSRFDKWY